MKQSRKRIGRWLLTLSLFTGASFIAPGLHADDVAVQANDAVATVQELKTKAFAAVRAGKFDLTSDYLSKAAALSKDPALVRMADWTIAFEKQRKEFAGERHKEYLKAVEDIKKLEGKNKEVFAMEIANRAYLLADDKEAFRKEAWLTQLLSNARKRAEEAEKTEHWLRSLRLYSQLSAIEPESAEWKERMKTSTRRIQLLALYVPDALKKIQEGDGKERDEVDAILRPTTKPSTRPSAADDSEAENQNRIDWREALRDVRMDMLSESIINARANYFRDVPAKAMMVSGLQAMKVVLTTPALEKAFAGLKESGKKAEFLGMIDANISKIEKIDRKDEISVLSDLMKDLRDTNNDTVKLPEAVLVAEFGNGAFSALDPFSSIIWPSDWEEFQKTTKGEFSGVGIQIMSDPDTGNLKVVSPLEDSPAFNAKIKPDYVITHIDGKSAKWISTNQAVKLITGAPGTQVTLTIRDTREQVKDYKLIRQTIKVASIKGWTHRPGGGWDYLIDPDQKIGYIRMTNFSRMTVDDMNRAIADMNREGVRGIIFDLRYNPGGLLQAATEVVDKFVTKGTIVSTRPDREDSPNQATIAVARNKKDEVETPLIVLVNQYSASASEIVSGALKDHHRALIVGERTFGKGSVQMLYPLGGQQAVLKLTTSHYYLPNGKCIHREENSKDWGVDPDVLVEMTPEQMRSAIDARQDAEVLREEIDPAGAELKPEVKADKSKKKDPLSVDAQLSAALLMMRLQLASGTPL